VTPHHDMLRGWLGRQESFPQCFLPRMLAEYRELKVAQLDRVVCMADGPSFVAWETGYQEEDTAEPLAIMWGWDGEAKTSLLERSIGEMNGNLMVQLPPNDPHSESLERLGFVLERYRLCLTPRQHDLETPQQGRYSLRLATELDRILLCTLAADYVVHTLPPGREELLAKYTTSILSRFRAIDFGPESSTDLFVAEENHRSVGYILVELMPDGSVCVEDVGVKRAHWGKYVAQFLIRATENLLVDEGLDLMWCEISAANRRSYITACRSLRFEPRLEFWMYRPRLL
jgi:hypothetical protein